MSSSSCPNEARIALLEARCDQLQLTVARFLLMENPPPSTVCNRCDAVVQHVAMIKCCCRKCHLREYEYWCHDCLKNSLPYDYQPQDPRSNVPIKCDACVAEEKQ